MKCDYCGKELDPSTALAFEGRNFCNSLHRYSWKSSAPAEGIVSPAAAASAAKKRNPFSVIAPVLGASLGTAVTTYMMKDAANAQIVGAIIGAAGVGILCGLIPWYLAKRFGQRTLGTIALSCCIFGGIVLGMYLAIPLALIFSGAVWGMARKEGKVGG